MSILVAMHFFKKNLIVMIRSGGQLLRLFEPIYKYLLSTRVQDMVRMISLYGSFCWIDPFCGLSKKEKSLYQLEGCNDGDEGEI